MENTKEVNVLRKGIKEDPSQELPDSNIDGTTGANLPAPSQRSTRKQFTSLDQVDSHLALARTLQEQERAYFILRMVGERGENLAPFSDGFVYEDEETDLNQESQDAETHEEEEGEESYVDGRQDADTDAQYLFDVDPCAFENDEAYARALQEAEERALAAQMMAFGGINEWEDGEDDEMGEDEEDNENNPQDAQQEIDPDELSYEELLALGVVVGQESKGLSADMIASLPSYHYNPMDSHNGTSEQCVICRFDYEEGDRLVLLPCKHVYHSECVGNWLEINKVCPVCNTEISTSATKLGK